MGKYKGNRYMNSEQFYNRLGIGVIAFGLAMVAVSYFITPAKAEDVGIFQDDAINTVIQLERNCSGVVFQTSNKSKSYIITANHCVDIDEKSKRVTIDVKDRQKVIETQQLVADVIQRDTEADLAVLRVRKTDANLPAAIVGTQDPKEGETVFVVGYPLGLGRKVTSGLFGGFESLSSKDLKFSANGDERALYTASPPIFGGNSGGGLFRKVDNHFELIGISDVVFPSFFVEGFYVPQDAINKVIQQALASEATEHVEIKHREEKN